MYNGFNVKKLEIEGVKAITPFFAEDNRGYFLKYYERDVFRELNITEGLAYEDFESYSKKGVIRGLHFQLQNPQEKIVHVIHGKINDIVVDLRKGSNTFGKHIRIELSDENHTILYIPKGFAHGFEVVSDYAIMSYKCIGKYISGADTGIYYNSPELNISWDTDNPIMTDKDKKLMPFSFFSDKYGGL